jgi:hypothetical protein
MRLSIAVALLLAGAALAEEKPRLLVSDLAAQGVTPEEAAAFTDAAVASLSDRGLFQVLSARELVAILGAERQRQILGVCEQNASACGNDLNAAAQVRFVLNGALARVGSAYQLTLQMLDTVKGQPIARASRLSNDLQVLRAQLPYAVAEATGSPLPPPPSRVLQYGLLAAGGAAIVAGGFSGMLAFSRQSVLNDELCPGGAAGDNCAGEGLRPRSYYLEQNQSLREQKNLSAGLVVAGAAAAVAGLLLMPPPEGGPRIALLPQPRGIALVGILSCL